MPAPSPRPYPSAAASKDFDRPSNERNLPLHIETNVSGRNIALAPPTRAMVHSPRSSARTAWWTATRDDEHAVSIVMDGPTRSSANEMRLESNVCEELVALFELIWARAELDARSPAESLVNPPTNTPIGCPLTRPACPASSSASQATSSRRRC